MTYSPAIPFIQIRDRNFEFFTSRVKNFKISRPKKFTNFWTTKNKNSLHRMVNIRDFLHHEIDEKRHEKLLRTKWQWIKFIPEKSQNQEEFSGENLRRTFANLNLPPTFLLSCILSFAFDACRWSLLFPIDHFYLGFPDPRFISIFLVFQIFFSI